MSRPFQESDADSDNPVAGGTITILGSDGSGTPIILGSDGSTAVVGTSSEPLLILPPDGSTAGPTAGPTAELIYPPCYVSSETCTVDGVTISGYTTIPSPTRHPGSRPTSGSAAFHALQPFGDNALRSLFAALSGFAGLGNSPSSQDLASLTNTFATAFSGKFYPVVIAPSFEMLTLPMNKWVGVS